MTKKELRKLLDDGNTFFVMECTSFGMTVLKLYSNTTDTYSCKIVFKASFDKKTIENPYPDPKWNHSKVCKVKEYTKYEIEQNISWHRRAIWTIINLDDFIAEHFTELL